MRCPNSFLPVALACLTVTLLGAGCGSSSTAPKGPDGGVWKSADRGTAWVNKKALVSGSKVTATAAQFDVKDMVMDPQDGKTLYLATTAHGLAYSLDGGDAWQLAKIPNVSNVSAVVVDPKDKCTVYAASANKIYKTETCLRDWQQIFFEPRGEVTFTQLVIDHYNPTVLYAGTSDGDLLRSQNSGAAWEKIKRIEGVAIKSLVMDPRDSRLIYAGTASDGIYKTVDGGLTWTQIKKQFGEALADGRRVVKIVLDPVEANVVYDVCKYGILKSTDQGETWTALNLTSPPGTLKIYALAIDPKNNKNLVYAGVSTLQFSSDGGISWTPKKLPTTQAGSAVIFDALDSNVLYLSTTPPPAKQQSMF
jgi:photosystem II stability/assembly factor-like uncharacterized protein